MLLVGGLLLGIGLTLAALVLAICFFVVVALGLAFIVTAISRLFRKRGRDAKESTSVAETHSHPASFAA